jgi:SAM-dependent methyltransferase
MTTIATGHETEHNRRQRTYFEAVLKRTMVPVESPYLERHVEELVEFGGLVRNDRILEVGCGMGRYTLLLAKRGIRIEGIDLSAVLLQRLREYSRGTFAGPLYAGDIEQPPQELTGTFDAVIALFTLHHMRDLVKPFRSMFRFVRPGGRVVFLEPNPYNPLFHVQALVMPGMSWKRESGILLMRRNVVFDALRQAGFVEPHMRRFGFLPPVVVNQPAGRKVEAVLERVPIWQPLLPFQLFRARRP